MKTEIVYMKVTTDKYQLSVAVATTTKELAEMCGTTQNAIYKHISLIKKGV